MKKAHVGEGALLGAALGVAVGAIVAGKKKGVIVSAIVGAAIGSTIGAQLRAKGNRIPYIVEDNGSIYKVYPDNSRRKMRAYK